MGFYLRKGVSVGPFRFNLSKSGIGVSTGLKGLRIGSGPRGNYVQMGRNGIYFRRTLPPTYTHPSPQEALPHQPSNIEFKEIDSGSTSRMVDSSSFALLEEISTKSKKALIWPWVLCSCIGLTILLCASPLPAWTVFLAVPLCLGALGWAMYADKLRKTVVLFYDLESHIEEAYQELHQVFNSLQNCSRMWHIQAAGNLTTAYDRKVNAGASAVVKRRQIMPRCGAPPYFLSNVSIPSLSAGRQELYFFPDRILVWDKGGVGAVGFEDLIVHFAEHRFIEDGGVPRDAKVVDKTWRYVNKNGGPDKRFNDNQQLPIVLYEELLLTSSSGLRELFQVSRLGLGACFDSAVKQMACAISKRGLTPEKGYFKCPCNNCDVFIEFPAHGVGQQVICPHCELETTLFKPTAQSR